MRKAANAKSISVRDIAIVLLIAIAAAAGPARASGTVDFTNPAFAQTGAQTSIPIGHAEFCRAHSAECRPQPLVEADILDNAKWRQLVQINAEINAAVVPVTDEKYYKVAEFWTYPNGYGDCEDFVLAKRRALIEAGWPASTLLIAVVRQANGDGHAVLMVRTDRGDLVLDNQDGLIKVWNETPYQYIKRQAQTDAGTWVDIIDHRPLGTFASR